MGFMNCKCGGGEMKSLGCVVCGVVFLTGGICWAGPLGAVGDLYVANRGTNTIVQIDHLTGEIVGDFVTTGLSTPDEARFGPNGNLFVANYGNDTITEHDGETGALIGVFADEGMDRPEGLRFKDDGHLLVFSKGSKVITEYDSSGVLIGVFASGLTSDDVPLNFGSDGFLYVSTWSANSVDRYDVDGSYLGVFASGGGLDGAQGHTFNGVTGNLLVTSWFTDSVIEYDGKTGVVVGTFIDNHLDKPASIASGPDGQVWVVNNFASDINEFDGVTGAWIRQITGLNFPRGMTVKPDTASCLSMSVSQLVAGEDGFWEISGVVPGAQVVVVYGSLPGSTVVHGQRNYCATFGIKGVTQDRVVGLTVADGSGTALIVKHVPSDAGGLKLLTQAAERGTCPEECVSTIDTQVIQ